MPLLPGARIDPVGMPNGIIDVPNSKFGTNRAGNSIGPMLPPNRARPSVVKVTK